MATAVATVTNVEAYLGRRFNNVDRPTTSDVAIVLTQAADAVNTEDLEGVGTDERVMLETLFAAHILSISSATNFSTDGVKIDARKLPGFFLDTYRMQVNRLKRSHFTIVND